MCRLELGIINIREHGVGLVGTIIIRELKIETFSG